MTNVTREIKPTAPVDLDGLIPSKDEMITEEVCGTLRGVGLNADLLDPSDPFYEQYRAFLSDNINRSVEITLSDVDYDGSDSSFNDVNLDINITCERLGLDIDVNYYYGNQSWRPITGSPIIPPNSYFTPWNWISAKEKAVEVKVFEGEEPIKYIPMGVTYSPLGMEIDKND